MSAHELVWHKQLSQKHNTQILSFSLLSLWALLAFFWVFLLPACVCLFIRNLISKIKIIILKHSQTNKRMWSSSGKGAVQMPGIRWHLAVVVHFSGMGWLDRNLQRVQVEQPKSDQKPHFTFWRTGNPTMILSCYGIAGQKPASTD